MKNDELFVEVEETYKDSNINLLYSRERRLENAPKEVKLLHSPDYIKRKSFFSSVWSDKGHKFIFIAILILVFLNLFFFFYYNGSDSGKISGIQVEMDTFQYGNALLVNVIFNERKDALQKNVKVHARALNAKGEEVYFSEGQGIYIGAKFILHFRIENNDIRKIETIIFMDEKVLNLSKRI